MRATKRAYKDLHVLMATDESTHAKAALATATCFPWPGRTDVQRITARQIRTEYRRSILLALDRSANLITAGARRALSRRWPDVLVAIVDTTPADDILREAKRVGADVGCRAEIGLLCSYCSDFIFRT